MKIHRRIFLGKTGSGQIWISIERTGFREAAAELEAQPGLGVDLGGALKLGAGRSSAATALDGSGSIELEGEDAADAPNGAASCKNRSVSY